MSDLHKKTGAMSHTNDPESSKKAAGGLNSSGKAASQRETVLSLVRRYPDKTACELAAMAPSGACRDFYNVRRRLSELRSDNDVRITGQRLCSVRGSQQSTWRANAE